MFTAAENEALIQATGGVTVVHGGETTYGHEEQVSVYADGHNIGQVLTTERTVVIADGILTGIGPKTGIGEAVTVNGTAREVRDIQPGDDDGGLLRLFLAD